MPTLQQAPVQIAEMMVLAIARIAEIVVVNKIMDTSKLIIWLIALLIVFGGGGFFLYSNYGAEPGIVLHPSVLQIYDQRKAGDYEGVAANYETIVNDPATSNVDKAVATITQAGAEFHISGDTKDRLEDVRRLKALAIDPALPVKSRVSAISKLASQDRDSGHDPEVFAEIFKGEPFATYFVQDDPELSIRHLYDWSYAQLPSVDAGIRIAEWNAMSYQFYPNLTQEELKPRQAMAIDYLQKVDAMVAKKIQEYASYAESTAYGNYRYMRATIMGHLAKQGLEPYNTEYRNEFEKYFQFAEASSNSVTKGDLPYLRLFYAKRLYFLEKDSAAAKIQLDLVAKELNAYERPETVGFVLYLKNTRDYKRDGSKGGFDWDSMPKLYAISPEFESAVTKALDAVSKSQQTTAAPTTGQ